MLAITQASVPLLANDSKSDFIPKIKWYPASEAMEMGACWEAANDIKLFQFVYSAKHVNIKRRALVFGAIKGKTGKLTDLSKEGWRSLMGTKGGFMQSEIPFGEEKRSRLILMSSMF